MIPRVIAATLATLPALTNASDSTITLDAGADDRRYTVTHWETGREYGYSVPQEQDRAVSVPHGDGSLVVTRGDERVDVIEDGDGGEPTRWATREDVDAVGQQVQEAGDAAREAGAEAEQAATQASEANAQAADARGMATRNRREVRDVSRQADAHDARLDRHGGRMETNSHQLDAHSRRLSRHSDHLQRLDHAVAAATAAGQHLQRRPGLSASLSAASYRGNAATSSALSWKGETVTARASWSQSGSERVIGGRGCVRVWGPRLPLR